MCEYIAMIILWLHDRNIYVHSIGSVDYHSGPYDVTFPAGQTNASFDVIINNDNILERNENFSLTIIVMKSLPRNVTTNAIAQATVTIIDNDSEYWNNLYVFELQAIMNHNVQNYCNYILSLYPSVL